AVLSTKEAQIRIRAATVERMDSSTSNNPGPPLSESLERFREAFQHAAVGMALVAPDGRWLHVNATLCSIIGYAEGEFLSNSFEAMAYPEDLGGLLDARRQLLDGQTSSCRLEMRYLHKEGRSIWVLLSLSLVRDKENDPLHLVFLVDDITELKLAEEALQESEERFRSLAERSSDMISRHTPVGIYLYVSPASETLLGYPPEDMIGQPPSQFVHPDDTALIETPFASGSGRLERFTTTYRVRRKDGTYTWFETTRWPLHDEQTGDLLEIQAASRDVSERKHVEDELSKAHEQLEALSVTDDLTGLKNKRSLADNLEREAELAVRHKTSFSIMLFDVDRLKERNETYGYKVGDDVLKGIALLLQRICRVTDMAARYDGEEFAVLLPHTDSSGAMIFAERFRRELENAPWEYSGVTASFGVATLKPTTLPGGVGAQLLANAKRAMSRAKENGRNCVVHASWLGEA
ncbi:MAG: PAS domain S-box protein, partial [Armatimonadota bacterium]|nr:PAS domain S-box protein [Armatimonadota bacterium]